MANEIEELIRKLEGAPRGSRELDAAIAIALGISAHEVLQTAITCMCSPFYTTSIDTALTLVPEGYAWCLYSDGSGEIGPEPSPGCLLNGEPFDGATPALAICIASLRARLPSSDAEVREG